MNQAIGFFKDYEAVIYFVLGLGGIVYIWRFGVAWQEMRSAVYGLERENAQRKLNQAAVGMFLLLMMALAVFLIVTFIIPMTPVTGLLPTATMDLLALSEGLDTTPSPQADDQALTTPTPLPTITLDENGCVEGVVEITSPQNDETIRGEVQILGSANIANMGFYKFEYVRADGGLWITQQAGRTNVENDVLVQSWDTSRLPAGAYILQLVVTDNEGEALPPCRVSVFIAPPE